MATTTPASTQKPSLPPPPRLTGDPATDMRILAEWMSQFYAVGVLQTGLLDPSFQSNPGAAIDQNNLPDPTATTIARAQLTANTAIKGVELAGEAAVTAQARADAAFALTPILATSFTLSEANNQSTLTFSAPLDNADYVALVQASDFSGSPAAEAFIVARVVKSVSSVVITFGAAPGSGNSITYDLILIPKPAS